MNDTFLTTFDLITPKNDWVTVPNNPAVKVTSSGLVKSANGNILQRYVKLRKVTQDNYDQIIATVEFKEGEDWVDIPNSRARLHRTGAVWSLVKERLLEVSVYLSDESWSVYSLIEEAFQKRTERLCYSQYLNLTNRYSPRLTFENLFIISPIKRMTTLCISEPDFLEQWYDVTEVGNVSKAKKSTKRLLRCNEHDQYFEGCPYNLLYGTSVYCTLCKVTTQERSELMTEVVDKAHKLELALYALILELAGSRIASKLESREVLGNSLDDAVFDLTCDSSKRCSQFKTMRPMTNPNHFLIQLRPRYPANLPIFGMDNEGKTFFAAMRGDLPADRADNTVPSVCVSVKNNHLYSKYVYTNKQLFIEAVLDLLGRAIQEHELEELGIRYCVSEKKAIQMIKNLRLALASRGLKFVGHINTRDDGVDGWIMKLDGTCRRSVQLKFTSSKHSHRYSVSLVRKTLGGVTPYSVEDGIDFFIIQIQGYDDFLIIPSDAMVKQELIAAPGQIGKHSMRPPPPDFNRTCWMMQFWNRYDLLTTTDYVHKVDGYLKLIADYEEQGRTVEYNDRNLTEKEITVDSRLIRVSALQTESVAFTITTVRGGKTRPYTVEDNLAGVVLIMNNRDRYCIPFSALIYKGYLSGISPGFRVTNDPWFQQFKDKLDSFFSPWVQDVASETIPKRVKRLLEERGCVVTDHRLRATSWLMVNGHRVNITTTKIGNAKPQFNASCKIGAFAVLFYYTDDVDCDFYLIRTEDLLLNRATFHFSKDHIPAGWETYKNSVDALLDSGPPTPLPTPKYRLVINRRPSTSATTPTLQP